MRSTFNTTMAAVLAFLSAVAMMAALLSAASARAVTGASQLKGAGREASAPMSLFRC